MQNFSNRSSFLGARRPHLAAGEAASTAGGRACPRLSGPAEPSQAEALQRCFFSKKWSLGKTLPLSMGEKWFQRLAFVFMENGEKFEGKTTKPFAFIETAKID